MNSNCISKWAVFLSHRSLFTAYFIIIHQSRCNFFTTCHSTLSLGEKSHGDGNEAPCVWGGGHGGFCCALQILWRWQLCQIRYWSQLCVSLCIFGLLSPLNVCVLCISGWILISLDKLNVKVESSFCLLYRSSEELLIDGGLIQMRNLPFDAFCLVCRQIEDPQRICSSLKHTQMGLKVQLHVFKGKLRYF